MKEQISGSQYTILVMNFFSAIMIAFGIQPFVVNAGNAYWYIPFLLWPVGWLMVLLLFRRLHHRKEFIPFSQEHVPGGAEKGVAILFLIFFLIIFAKDLQTFSFFINIALLPKTPTAVILVLATLSIIYLAHGGLEVVARFTDLFFPIVFLILIFSPLFTWNQIDPANLLPLLRQEQVPGLLKGTFLALSSFSEWLIALLLIPYVDKRASIRRLTLFSLGLGLFFVLIIFLTNLLTLGVPILRDVLYSTYLMVRQIHLTDFLDRMDLFMVAVWMPTYFAKLALNVWALSRLCSLILGINRQVVTGPMAFLGSLLALLLFPDTIRLYQFSTITWSTLGLVLELLIFLFYLGMIHRSSGKNSHEERGGDEEHEQFVRT
ncbi:GerAB/ArcD/ProY family transporter [Rubeoparvulum massiliense]|uniref:GerAB/ArcD/ProY family transporter n=1 Tax=Rubeoparvulum massiliense TaxID=1631346 RepID=UPI00065E84DE|nr:GerAB/ArcD/ProY family transporter [Rubeoparvulum massiliense]